MGRVILNINADTPYIALRTDNVFIIIPLPHVRARRVSAFIDTAGRERFEGAHDFRQRVAFERNVVSIVYRRRGRSACKGCFAKTCPYNALVVAAQNNDTMNMVRHYDKRSESYMAIVPR